MVNTKVLLLVPIVLAIAGISAYLVLGNSSGPVSASTTPSLQESTVTSSTTAQESRTSNTQTGQTSAVKSVTVRLTNDGFNGTAAFRLNLKQGDQVIIKFVYEDKLSDIHPLFLTGYDLQGPTLSPQQTEGTMEFTADQVGKFGLLCLNANCKTHDKLVTALVIVS
ncbi:MAG: hypothetical protein HYW93_03765 [Thaumarchaeota archaeon]|nr:hypothetical protein [Nitrososphaerota archaeon]